MSKAFQRSIPGDKGREWSAASARNCVGNSPGKGNGMKAIKTDNISVAQILAAAHLTELWLAGLESTARQALTATEIGEAYKASFEAVVA
jgi:hypothetical protein